MKTLNLILSFYMLVFANFTSFAQTGKLVSESTLSKQILEYNTQLNYNIYSNNMKKFFYFLLLAIVIMPSFTIANNKKIFDLSNYQPYADNRTDDSEAFNALFNDVQNAGGGTVTIPAGEYFLSGLKSLKIPSNTTVFAYGAKFVLPKTLGDQARIVLFKGLDVTNFTWFGGHFEGHCFDHRNPPNTWEPNVTTRIFVISTSEKGKTDRILFRDVSANKIAGAVVNVEGFKKVHDTPEVENFATNVTVENCTFLESGKFMWDYGLLWQIIVFSDEYSDDDLKMAKKYFRNDLVRGGVTLKDGDDKVYFNNTIKPIAKSVSNEASQALCFFDDQLPQNIIRGKQYFVVESAKDYLKISESFDGKPIKFNGSSGLKVKLMNDMFETFMMLYAPTNFGPGKGCIDYVACKNTRISGCSISALGDAMHIFSCHNNIFSNNQILGARMGAFFLAEYSKNSTIVGNTVNGTNGSRVISIEKSNEDVTVIGNTFQNGGRGSWINQPKNLVMKGNIFINNTSKCQHDPWKGRKSYKTGTWQNFAEIYFTTYAEGANYGPVILTDNIFETGPEADAAIQFEKNGVDVWVDGNTFKGHTGVINLNANDSTILFGKNPGAKVFVSKDGGISKYSNK